MRMKNTTESELKFYKAKINYKCPLLLMILLTAFILGECVSNAVNLQEKKEASTELYVKDITRMMAKSLHDTVEYKKADLVNVADSMGNVEGLSDGLEGVGFLERKAEILDFDMLILINSAGRKIMSTKAMKLDLGINIKEMAELPEVQTAFSGTATISCVGDQSLVYAAPVRQKEEIVYVLLGVRSKENMQSLIAAESFDGECLNCIVDAQGSLISSPSDDMQPFEQLWEVFETGSDEIKNAIIKFQEDMKEGESGSFEFKAADGTKNYLAYNSLEVNDWNALSIVPVDTVSAAADKFIQRSLVLLACVSVAIVIFWLIIYGFYSANRKQLTRLAFLDAVTGGMNNAAFQMRFRKMAEKNSMEDYVIVLLDVRDFKMVNENFGIEEGNKMLRYIYETLNRHLRTEDGEFAARAESDRYVLCVRETEDRLLQKRIQKMIGDVNSFRNEKTSYYELAFKVGACRVREEKLDIAVLQDHARTASQMHRQNTEGNCVFYDKQIVQQLKWEKEMEAQFASSLQNRDFEVYLQPKAGVKDDRLTGAEALIRWNYPGKGMIAPAEFVPVFEKNGKICRLDLYLFEEVCRILSRWKEEGRPLCPISVNLSRYHFYGNNALAPFEKIFQKYDLPADCIEFELTETIFVGVAQLDRMQKEIAQMHRVGFRCSMDDFGSGYSSLGLLREFDVDTVKLDRRFFLDITTAKSRNVILCVTELVKRLKMTLVAEGIETPEQLEYLRELDCDEVQGYIYSRPLPVEEFEKFWSEREGV